MLIQSANPSYSLLYGIGRYEEAREHIFKIHGLRLADFVRARLCWLLTTSRSLSPGTPLLLNKGH